MSKLNDVIESVRNVFSTFTESSEGVSVLPKKIVTFANLGHNKVKITVSSKTQRNEITARVFAPEAIRQVQGFVE